jgi:hypothetical protein
MKYAFEKIPGRIRLISIAVLLLLTVLFKAIEQIPDFFSGFMFGLLLIFVVAEVAIYLKRKASNSK